nr:MAG TPA: hypothetical protein [Caudoviricetes sp.]
MGSLLRLPFFLLSILLYTIIFIYSYICIMVEVIQWNFILFISPLGN